MELKYLVEGQKNALDAIKLKEYLVPHSKPKLKKIQSESDRIRVEGLLKDNSFI